MDLHQHNHLPPLHQCRLGTGLAWHVLYGHAMTTLAPGLKDLQGLQGCRPSGRRCWHMPPWLCHQLQPGLVPMATFEDMGATLLALKRGLAPAVTAP